MRFPIILILTISLALVSCSGKGGDKASVVAFPDSLVDGEVVATVNKVDIVGRDLRVFTMVYEPASRDSLHNRMYNLQLLNGFIDRSLLGSEANTLGITVADSVTDWYTGKFVQAIGGAGRVAAFLEDVGITSPELRQMIRRDLIIRQYMESRILPTITVTPDEARAFYDANPQFFTSKDSVSARHIILRGSPSDTDLDKQAKKQTLRDLRRLVMDEGESFADLAATHSQGPSAANGGNLGYFSRDDMVAPFSDAAFALQPGQVSDVVETQFGYHIIYVDDRKAAALLTYEEVEPQLIEGLRRNQLASELEKHLQRLRSAAIIEPGFDYGGLTQRESATFTR